MAQTDQGVQQSLSSIKITELILQVRSTKIFETSLDIGLYDCLSKLHQASAIDVARELGFERKADLVGRLLDSCVAFGLVLKERNGDVWFYRNTPETESFLTRHSADNLLDYALLVLKGKPMNVLTALSDANVDGANLVNVERYEDSIIFKDPSYTKLFCNGMDSHARTGKDTIKMVDLVDCKTVVDLGGGLGCHLRVVKQKYPNVRAILVELPPVISLARQVAENNDLGIEFVEADMYKEGLPMADIYILAHIVHDRSESQIATILSNAHRSLNNGGRVVLLQKVLQANRTGPLVANVMDVAMFTYFCGRERTEEEYKELLEKHSFAKVEFIYNNQSAFFDAIIGHKSELPRQRENK